jgi:hypothetical protein
LWVHTYNILLQIPLKQPCRLSGPVRSYLSEVASIFFVGAGGTVNDCRFPSDSTDVTEALAVLGKAGMRGVAG